MILNKLILLYLIINNSTFTLYMHTKNNYFYTLRNVLDELLYLVIFPIYALTHGFILYPVYICSHISKQKKIIQRYDNDINCINELAKQAQFRADEHLKSATYNDDCFTIDRTGNKKSTTINKLIISVLGYCVSVS